MTNAIELLRLLGKFAWMKIRLRRLRRENNQLLMENRRLLSKLIDATK